jgi:glutathione synthase/RimK-type ligase-like ATP-grasp enzyme
LIGDNFYFERPIPSSEFLAPYTRELRPDILSSLEVDDTPGLIQAKVEKIFDVRAVVVDNNVLAYALHQHDAESVDFRLNEITRVQPIGLPNHVAEGLTNLVRDMHLRFAACDLILGVDGQFTFLEANVSGNWLFCELNDDFRITKSIARSLSPVTGSPD